MEMTGVYDCLCQAVCDVTTVPSHLKKLAMVSLEAKFVSGDSILDKLSEKFYLNRL